MYSACRKKAMKMQTRNEKWETRRISPLGDERQKKDREMYNLCKE